MYFAQEMSVSSSSPDDAVMGREGARKSSSANTRLGENRFIDQESGVIEGQTQIRHRQDDVLENRGKCIKRKSSMDNLVNFSGETPAMTDEIPQRKDQIRLLLLGLTGVGGIVSVNTISSRNCIQFFISSVSQCQSETIVRNRKLVSVINTAGLCDSLYKAQLRGFG
nr:Hypothetical LOC556402 [Danio rerio]AAI62647.1 Hypothetical LOC556402 [Danio rerio]